MVKSLVQDIREFNPERDWEQFHSPKNLAIALVVEAGEVAEIFQWLTEEESRNLSPEALTSAREELGDVFIYLLNLADNLHIDLLRAARDKLNKNAERYPTQVARGKSLKYTKYEES